MFFLVIIAVLSLCGIYSNIKKDKCLPSHPAPPIVMKNPRRIQLEAAIRKIAGGDVSEEKMNALTLEAPHVLVTARAGSGKTTTIAIKTALAVHQGARPEQLLSLCFNRRAATELGNRFTKYSVGNAPASTFHSLAFQIVRPRPCSLIFGERQLALLRHLIGKSEKQEKDEEDETEDMLEFISSCKHKGLSVEDVLARCENAGSQALQAANIYAAYTKYLKSHALMDFDDLIETATTKLESLNRAPVVRINGKVCDLNALHLLAIDEFQDLSRSFHGLVQALRDRNSSMGVYAVGDDWQAINSFAGSSPNYFNNFKTHFPGAERTQLQTNYRSYKNIVEYSNQWMKGYGAGGVAIKDGGIVQHLKISGGGIGGLSVHQVLRELVARERGRSVLVLTRQNMCHGMELMALQKELSRFNSNARVSTIHRAKGCEADTVFFIKESAMKRCHLSHLNATLGMTEAEVQAEERRIEYVALTRAKERLLIVQ